MKRKSLYIVLASEALLLVVLNLVQISLTGIFTTILAFPFEPLGRLLRFLSLSGRFGNAIALTLYAAICLLPIWLFVCISKKRKRKIEDGMLFALSALLFLTLERMINPGNDIFFLSSLFSHSPVVAKSILGGTTWSILIGYLLLRMLRLSFESDNEKLNRYLFVLLDVLNAAFIWAIFGSGFQSLLSSFASLRANNIGTEDTLFISYLFLVLRFAIDVLPYAFSILTVFLAQDMLKQIHADSYSEASVLAAKKLSHWCKKTLIAVIISNIGFNIIQILFASKIRNVNSTLSIPLISLIFVLCLLLFARIMAQSREIKHDNDLFI
ncbi:MAG: hypothetical protein E7256_04720 [Lachnospiraceae bacterium]|nr:hypothetical protein [Lachnospiraceae bacterium]